MATSRQILTFDFGQHLLDIRRGVFTTRCFPHRRQFFARISHGLIVPGLSQGLPDPLGHRHVVSLRDAPDFGELVVLKEDLQSSSHT